MIRVTIAGVGLIGGSLGMALRRHRRSGKRTYRVTGWGNSLSRLKLAQKRGAVDDFSTQSARAFSSADIVVVCVPVGKIAPVISAFRKYLKPGAIVTDVGSVKKAVVQASVRALARRKDVSFVGGHPIAGSEKTGVEFSRADLFENATCVLTKDGASFRALEKIMNLWVSTGARCVLLSAAEHDRWLAMTSHLPHLMAFALASQVEGAAQKHPVVSKLAGGSFRDMTRIAHADMDLWKGIIRGNRVEIKKAVAEFVRQLRRFAA